MENRLLGYMAIDQHGQTVHLTEPKHPRKQLLIKLGVKSCQKQMQDLKDGTTVHDGYIIGSRWFTLYEVRAWRGKP